MRKENFTVTISVIGMLVFIHFASWFFRVGYDMLVELENPTATTEEVSSTVDISPLTNFVTDFYTKCTSTEQFGIDYVHSIEFSEYETSMSECYYKYDNRTTEGHTVSIQPTLSLEMWYNKDAGERYVTMTDSNTADSVDWVKLDYAKCDGNLGEFFKQQSDAAIALQTVEALLKEVVKEHDSIYNIYEDRITVYHKTTDCVLDVIQPMLGSDFVDYCELYAVYSPVNEHVVKYYITVHYLDNEYNILNEKYTYTLKFTKDYYLTAPDIVTTKTSTIKDLEKLYHNIMK